MTSVLGRLISFKYLKTKNPSAPVVPVNKTASGITVPKKAPNETVSSGASVTVVGSFEAPVVLLALGVYDVDIVLLLVGLVIGVLVGLVIGVLVVLVIIVLVVLVPVVGLVLVIGVLDVLGSDV